MCSRHRRIYHKGQQMSIPLSLLTLHFLGDFILQSDWMALNKSKQWDVLAIHAGVYSACFLWWGFHFVALTFALHFMVDCVTSRLTSNLWFMEEVPTGEGWWTVKTPNPRHWFFVMIGLDQLIHYTLLLLTLRIIS